MSFTPADQVRLAALQIAQGITPGLSHLTPQQIQKGIAHVLNQTQTQGRPPAHILARNQRDADARARFADDLVRARERAAAPEADRAGGVHELPAGRLDAAGKHGGMLLPHASHDRLGHPQTGQDPALRRAGASETGSRRIELVAAAKPAAQVLRLTPEPAALDAAQGVQEAMASVKEAAAQATQAEAHRLEQKDKTKAEHPAHIESAEAQKVATPRTGKMTGTVKAVDGRGFALAKNREGDLVWHDMDNLPGCDLPKVGETVNIDYVNGVGKVAEKVPGQGQGR